MALNKQAVMEQCAQQLFYWFDDDLEHYNGGIAAAEYISGWFHDNFEDHPEDWDEYFVSSHFDKETCLVLLHMYILGFCDGHMTEITKPAK